jgi:hypothetical protein
LQRACGDFSQVLVHDFARDEFVVVKVHDDVFCASHVLQELVFDDFTQFPMARFSVRLRCAGFSFELREALLSEQS